MDWVALGEKGNGGGKRENKGAVYLWQPQVDVLMFYEKKKETGTWVVPVMGGRSTVGV